MTMYRTHLANLELNAKVMGITFHTKRGHWTFPLWGVLDRGLKLFGHPGILDKFFTAGMLGKTFFSPGAKPFFEYDDTTRYSILYHEMQHLWDKFGLDGKASMFHRVWWSLKYLTKAGRREAECRAYLRSLEAEYVMGGESAMFVATSWVLTQLTGKNYFSLMSGEECLDWIGRAVEFIKKESGEANEPLPISLPDIPTLTISIPF